MVLYQHRVLLAYVLIYSFVFFFLEISSTKAEAVLGFAYLIYIYVWFISTGRWQGIYIREKFGANYSRKSWGKPLLLAILGYCATIVVLAAAAFFAGAFFGLISEESTPPTAAITAPATSVHPKDCDFCPLMVVIPAGSFTMGSPNSEAGRDSDEGPLRQVDIVRSFSLGKFEITFGEFKQFVQSTGYSMTGGCFFYNGKEFVKDAGKSWNNPGFYQTNNDPVTCVSWDDATAYAKWLSKVAQKPYRLPSEAEWEYAARAQSKTAYSFGNSPSELSGYAWFSSNSEGKTHAVGMKQANKFGLHDMHGNVLEWTQDCWNENYNGAPSDGSVWSAGDCSRRVLRGGSWFSSPQDLRSAYRNGNSSSSRNYYDGFRVSRTD